MLSATTYSKIIAQPGPIEPFPIIGVDSFAPLLESISYLLRMTWESEHAVLAY